MWLCFCYSRLNSCFCVCVHRNTRYGSNEAWRPEAMWICLFCESSGLEERVEIARKKNSVQSFQTSNWQNAVNLHCRVQCNRLHNDFSQHCVFWAVVWVDQPLDVDSLMSWPLGQLFIHRLLYNRLGEWGAGVTLLCEPQVLKAFSCKL